MYIIMKSNFDKYLNIKSSTASTVLWLVWVASFW